MVENESKVWEKLCGKKIGTEKLSIEGFKNQIPFEIYDGYAYCENYKGHRYDMSYPQLKAVRESEEMATAVLNYINQISDKKLESTDEIGVIHCLITFNTLYRDGVEIIPKTKEAA
jgi:hypothetical protein